MKTKYEGFNFDNIISDLPADLGKSIKIPSTTRFVKIRLSLNVSNTDNLFYANNSVISIRTQFTRVGLSNVYQESYLSIYSLSGKSFVSDSEVFVRLDSTIDYDNLAIDCYCYADDNSINVTGLLSYELLYD